MNNFIFFLYKSEICGALKIISLKLITLDKKNRK